MSATAAGKPSTIFDASPTYRMACEQLYSVAEIMDTDPDIIARLAIPKRSLIMAVPVRMDSGEVQTFVGYRVQHSLTSGASKGGLRYAPHVDLGEVAALSMWMSWKVGIMNLPFSGAKGGIACDPTKLSRGELERLTRRYTEEVLPIIGPRIDVMAPDMGTDEQTMAWIMDTYSMKIGYACPEIVTGKPVELGGCVGRREATGRGVTYCIMEALGELGLQADESTAVVQGFGNVGSVVCQELHQRGVKIIAIGDRFGSIKNAKGIDIPALVAHVAAGKQVKDFPGAERIEDSELLAIPCTILAPCAMERVITKDNAARVNCRILAEGANGPTTPEADRILANTDIFVIPDVICNAGGVTVSYFEWVQDRMAFFWTQKEVEERMERIMVDSFTAMVDMAKRFKESNRIAAYMLGVNRVAETTRMRGIYA